MESLTFLDKEIESVEVKKKERKEKDKWNERKNCLD